MSQSDRNLPLISIVTPTLNNGNSLEYFLQTIRRQDYPKNKIEIIIVDGGSKDKTLNIAKKNKLRIFKNPHVLAEPGIAIGMQKAKGDLIMVLATDNIFKSRRAYRTVAQVFEDKSVYAALPKQDYDESDNLFTRYHNTFTDPFNHFVQGDTSNARTFHKIYKTLVHNDIYDVYDYHSSETVPMISFSQGFTIRGSYKRDNRDDFDDNRPVIELIRKNKKIAYIHSLSIYHHTINNLQHFIKKQRWATQNALEGRNYGIAHRYNTLSSEQRLRIKLWPFYALSVIFPLLNSVRGLFRDREIIWLFHPVNCLIMAYANFVQLFVFIIAKIGFKTNNVSRQ